MKKWDMAAILALTLLFPCLQGCGDGSVSTVDAGNGDARQPPAGSDAKAAADVAMDAKATPGDTGGLSASSTQTLVELTTAERQALCDQVAANQGGYGRVVQCSGSIQATDSSQASCVAGIPSLAVFCPALTVGDLIGCSLASGPDLCSYPTVPECSAVFDCLG